MYYSLVALVIGTRISRLLATGLIASYRLSYRVIIFFTLRHAG
jgi:hypothetical protein